jgi:hypothetical protein
VGTPGCPNTRPIDIKITRQLENVIKISKKNKRNGKYTVKKCFSKFKKIKTKKN